MAFFIRKKKGDGNRQRSMRLWSFASNLKSVQRLWKNGRLEPNRSELPCANPQASLTNSVVDAVRFPDVLHGDLLIFPRKWPPTLEFSDGLGDVIPRSWGLHVGVWVGWGEPGLLQRARNKAETSWRWLRVCQQNVFCKTKQKNATHASSVHQT